MIIDRWQELLTGQKTRHSIFLRRHESVTHSGRHPNSFLVVKHALSGRCKLQQDSKFFAVAPGGHFPSIMVSDWHAPDYIAGAAYALDYCRVREVYAGGRWYQQVRHEAVAAEYDLKPGWFKDDFEDSHGANLSAAQLSRNGFKRVVITIKNLHETDVRQMNADQILREGYPDFVSFAQFWCGRADRSVSRILANIASRDGIPAAERERVARLKLMSRPDEFYRAATLEISI